MCMCINFSRIIIIKKTWLIMNDHDWLIQIQKKIDHWISSVWSCENNTNKQTNKCVVFVFVCFFFYEFIWFSFILLFIKTKPKLSIIDLFALNRERNLTNKFQDRFGHPVCVCMLFVFLFPLSSLSSSYGYEFPTKKKPDDNNYNDDDDDNLNQTFFSRKKNFT